MIGVAHLALRRPWLAILGWLAATGCFGALSSGLIGPGLAERLGDTTLVVPGTESARAVELFSEEFGESVSIPVLLRGPAGQLDRQGPELVSALRGRDDMRTLSPWDRGEGLERLRPEPDAALVVTLVDVDVRRDLESAGQRVRELIDREIEDPVRAHPSGLPMIGSALREETFDQARSAERIAIPLLIVVLLLVFRTPLAAAVPLLFGIATVVAGSGILTLLGTAFEINVIAMSLASMMGLALGVDYSLLIVARFREELARGTPIEAAASAAATAGRTVMFAGITTVAAMLAALLLSPGDLLLSAALGVIVVAVWSVLASFAVTPAALVLLGPNVNRWPIPLPGGGGAGWGAVAVWVMRRPLVAALPVLALLLLVAAPALGLESGPADVRQLPPEAEARQDFVQIEETMGPGWANPFEVMVVSSSGPITTERRLRRIERWQEEVAADPNVQAVVGPGAMRGEAEELGGLGQRLDDLGEAGESLAELEQGLADAERGAGELRGGIAEAAGAASAMAGGAGEAAARTAELQGALERALEGATRLVWGLRSALDGAGRLARGASEVVSGAEDLERGIADARRRVERSAPAARRLAEGLGEGADELGRLQRPAAVAESEVEAVVEALQGMSIGTLDPRYPEALAAALRAQAALTGRDPLTGARIDPDYPGMVAALEQAERGLRRASGGAEALARGSERLAEGLRQLEQGADELGDGVRRVSDGAESLEAGLARLLSGAIELRDGLARIAAGGEALRGGLGRLRGGLAELDAGLDEGARGSGELAEGIGEMREGVARVTAGEPEEVGQELRRFQRRAPRLFDSGYFVLAALDGARRADRERARFAVNVERGGQAGRIMVVPTTRPDDPQIEPLRTQLAERAGELARDAEVETAVGGPGALLAEFDAQTSRRFPLLVVALSLITYLFLVPIFRALLLPAIGVLLNLVTVAAAFGVLTLLFVGPDPPLGGPGFIDAVAMAGIFAVIFALSIDYQVFLVMRMREHYPGHGAGEEAIRLGIARTAGVITGAAAIMAGVFSAFALTEIASLRQFGIGLTVAVLLDATIVRLVLLPAAMRAGGKWTWWLPAWLDRRLPRLTAE